MIVMKIKKQKAEKCVIKQKLKFKYYLTFFRDKST